jgi:hypothetical protein
VLWQESAGKIVPEDLSGNLIGQLGAAAGDRRLLIGRSCLR